MLEQLLDSGPRGAANARTWPVLPFSFLVHAAPILLLVATSYLTVGTVDPPGFGRDPLQFFRPKPPAPPAAALPIGVTLKRAARERKAEPVKPPPDEMIQPQVIPEAIPEEDLDDDYFEDEFLGDQLDDLSGRVGDFGVPWGDPNGDPNGRPDGVPWGDGSGGGDVIGGQPVEEYEPEIVRITGDISPPERTHQVVPEYPRLAREARAEGKVYLEIVVVEFSLK